MRGGPPRRRGGGCGLDSGPRERRPRPAGHLLGCVRGRAGSQPHHSVLCYFREYVPRHSLIDDVRARGCPFAIRSPGERAGDGAALPRSSRRTGGGAFQLTRPTARTLGALQPLGWFPLHKVPSAEASLTHGASPVSQASVPSPFVSSWVQCGGRFADRDLDAPARLTLAIQASQRAPRSASPPVAAQLPHLLCRSASLEAGAERFGIEVEVKYNPLLSGPQSLEGSVRTAERLAPELAAIFTRLLRALRLASGAVEGPFGPTSGEGPRVGFLEEPSASAAAGAAAAASGAAAPPAAVEPESQPAATGRGSGVQGSAASEAAEAATPEPDRRASGRGAERESRDSRRGRSPTSRRGRRGDPDDEGEAAGGEERRGRAREGGRRAAAESPTPAAGAPEGAGVAPSAEPPPAAAGPAAFASGGAEAQAAPAAAEAQRCSAAEVPADQGPRDWDWGPLARDPLQGISTDVLSAAVFGRPLADW